MVAQHDSLVQCRDFAVQGERRNVGVLTRWPAPVRAELARGQHMAQPYLVVADVAFGKVLLTTAVNCAGRAREVRHQHPHIRLMTMAEGPESGHAGRAFDRLRVIFLADAGLNLVPPDRQTMAAGLDLLGPGTFVAEAIRA
jgi:hypothetical protein